MAKPDLIKWVPSDDPAKIQDPGTTKKSNGFLYLEKPPFQYFNYLFNKIYRWFLGLQGSYADVVVGSSSQVTAGEATHTVTQLTNGVVATGTRVMFLAGTHALTADILLTNANVCFEMENAAAIIDLGSTYKFGANGARAQVCLKFANITAATDAVQVTGASSYAQIHDVPRGNITGSSSSVIVLAGTAPTFKVGNIAVPAASGALTDGANIAWDLAVNEIASVTLGGDRTLSNPTNKRVGRFTLVVTQDGTGGRLLAFDTEYLGTKVFVKETAGAVTVIEFICDGTNMHFHPSAFSTGDAKPTLKTTADSGWVMANDGTIGSAASGGTTRAKADTIDLYTLIWTNVDNTSAPIQDSSGSPTTRGASAAADFAANKRLSLTKMLGRALSVAGSGSGLTARALGVALGAETHALTTSEMPSHNHELNFAASTLQSGSNTASFGNGASAGAVFTRDTGGGNAHNNMQPSTFMNFMVKL